MEEVTNNSKLESIFRNNGGYITREDIDNEGISSWFLSDFVKKHNLIKVAPGFYADKSYFIDYYQVLQKRYPKYIYAGMSALYLHHLTDKIPLDLEVVAPKDYHPCRYKIENLVVRKISSKKIYELGIIEIKTQFGNKVKVYDEERTICDLIKYRDKYDSETFVKAIKSYIRQTNNQVKLFKYARTLKIEAKVFSILEVINNND